MDVDGQGLWGRAGHGTDGGGRPGTARVMSHDATMIHSDSISFIHN